LHSLAAERHLGDLADIQLHAWTHDLAANFRSENLTADSAAQVVVDPELHGRALDRITLVAAIFAVVEEGETSLGNHCLGLITNATRERSEFIRESLVHPIGDDGLLVLIDLVLGNGKELNRGQVLETMVTDPTKRAVVGTVGFRWHGEDCKSETDMIETI